MRLSFIVPGPMQPAERPRVFGRRAVTPPRTRAAEEEVAAIVRSAAKRALWRVTEADIAVEVVFVRGDMRRPDIDNLTKTVMDGVTKSGAVWKDDRQVVELSARRIDGKGQTPQTQVVIEVAS